jgi:hypothetical protein
LRALVFGEFFGEIGFEHGPARMQRFHFWLGCVAAAAVLVRVEPTTITLMRLYCGVI